jgi:hypothetical protein
VKKPIAYTYHKPIILAEAGNDAIHARLAEILILHFGKFPIVLTSLDIPKLETIEKCEYKEEMLSCNIMTVLINRVRRGDITVYYEDKP